MESNKDSSESIPGRTRTPATDAAQVVDDLVRVEVRLYSAIDARLRAAHGSGLGRFEQLRVVGDVPDCRVSDLVRVLAITVGAASKGVDRQVRDGLVRRTVNPADRRSSFLALTPEGRRLLDGMRPTYAAAGGELLDGAGLRERDLAAVADALAALRTHLEATASVRGHT
ncbi:MarR family winged helix-turn-helix transcriptional regulator [Antribacter sp. KLBMP9083]|uniref:MarR family winged helix-turn-helix transcriptional regulator n=1 Tax=Antribacter soli TaxID=2910976 RepID=A0AA41U9M1_9MICO|nr:MarR family winged helix-turn-helix transcriptional regulator [Antribacter soli]MCF4121757.1 MarR family winged helix-turn-helix transcriptional regulator [Antribacter soli]